MSLCQTNGSHVPALERRAQGVVDPHNPGKRRIVVTVDEATFQAVGEAADLADISVSEALRQIIRRGLDAPAAAPPSPWRGRLARLVGLRPLGFTVYLLACAGAGVLAAFAWTVLR